MPKSSFISPFFYVNNDAKIDYAELISKLNQSPTVDTYYIANNYIDFSINIINAIINNVDIVMYDYRNTAMEYASIDETLKRKVNVENNLQSIKDLIEKIYTSISSIGIYSSGTEAKPKLIYQPVQRLLKSVQRDEKYTYSTWGFTYNPAHSAGIQMMLQVLCNQGCIYDLYKQDRTSILNVLQQNSVQYISATPTFYRMLSPYDFKVESIESLTLNGEKSTQDLIDNVKTIFPNAKIRNIYGSTESGPLMSSDSATFIVPNRLTDKIKIDENELLISSHLISKSVNAEEWYHTGDLVKVVNENPLTIEFISRKTRIINVGGQNVNPQEVEEILLQHKNIKDVRVFGRSHKIIGNIISAEIQLLDKDINTSEKEILDFCKSKLATYKIPKIVKFVENIEVGRTGKKSI